MLRGTDVSHHQGAIQWDAFAPHNDFVVIRATYGKDVLDRQFKRNRSEAARIGLIRGYYHFALPAHDAATQADFFCHTVGDLAPGDLDLVLDLEWTQHQGKTGH